MGYRNCDLSSHYRKRQIEKYNSAQPQFDENISIAVIWERKYLLPQEVRKYTHRILKLLYITDTKPAELCDKYPFF